MKITYLALKIFSAKGGIEQVNKNWLFALKEISKTRNISYKVCSMYDKSYDERYINKNQFNSFNGNKLLFALKTIWHSVNANYVVLSHLNLSIVALIAKLLNPKLKIIIQLHGIEAWRELSGVQELLLEKADTILAVSSYTANIINNRYPKHQHKTKVFHNSLDVFISDTINTSDDARLKAREKLNISNNQFIFLTIGRLNSSESYKGYDKTIEALSILKERNFKFYIIGKYDTIEKERINRLINSFNLSNQVDLLGYVTDEELINYYRAADLFIMPSKGEGFGLVFIDAMAHGLRVVGGNADGSVDAISPFNESVLVNPDNINEIRESLLNSINSEWLESNRKELSIKCVNLFSANKFKEQVEKLFF